MAADRIIICAIIKYIYVAEERGETAPVGNTVPGCNPSTHHA